MPIRSKSAGDVRSSHTRAMMSHEVKKEFKTYMEGRMTAFEAYWQALHARLAAFYSTRHRFWRMRNTSQ